MLLLRLDREVFFVATRRMDTPTPSGSSFASISIKETCPGDGPLLIACDAVSSSLTVLAEMEGRDPASGKVSLSNARLMKAPSSFWLCEDIGWWGGCEPRRMRLLL